MSCRRKYIWLLFASLQFTQALPATIYGQREERAALEKIEGAMAVARGEQVYTRACAPCHGANGDGKGPFSKALFPKPRDFRLGKFKFRTTTSRSLPTDEDIFRTISKGIPGTFMPAWEQLLSEKDRMALVQYIKTFSKRFADSEDSFERIDVSNEVSYSEVSIAKGSKVYVELECASCHGDKGRGHGPSSRDLKDEWGYPIRPPDLTKSWKFKGGDTRKDLYYRFMSGLSGTPMPSVAESFALDEEIQEIQIRIEDGEVVTAEERKRFDEAMAEIRQKVWHLTNYVKSLSKEPGLFYRLFVEDTEVTK
ncbi:MAG: c-type cytochrome [bacterium]